MRIWEKFISKVMALVAVFAAWLTGLINPCLDSKLSRVLEKLDALLAVKEMAEEIKTPKYPIQESEKDRIAYKLKDCNWVAGVEYTFSDTTCKVLAGPYINKPANICGIKLAKEISAACSVNIPIEDFSVPSVDIMIIGLMETLILLRDEGVIYAGCMGGVGRTGMLLALLKAFELVYNGGELPPDDSVISWVRREYNSHAVETAEQMAFVNKFPIEKMADLFRLTNFFG